MTWTPLQNQGPPNNPNYLKMQSQVGLGADETKDEQIWRNDLYEVVATRHKLDPLGTIHMSIKRLDRKPLRDWRHLQQIKNEIVGPEAEAFEIFPAESRMVDTANQYHLWATPAREGATDEESQEAVMVIPIPRDPETGYLVVGWRERLVSSDQQAEAYNRTAAEGRHKGQQEPWEDGLTTGGDRNEKPDPRLDQFITNLPDPDTTPVATIDVDVAAGADVLYELLSKRNRRLTYPHCLQIAAMVVTAALGITDENVVTRED